MLLRCDLLRCIVCGMNCKNVGTATLHYKARLDQPDACTVVFINSLGTDFRIWDGVVAALPKHLNIVLHDKAGHGLSSTMRNNLTIETYAEDLQNLLVQLQCKNIVLCGISVGGLIAQQLLQNSSLNVRGAVLSNSGLKIGNDAMWNTRISGVETSGLDGIADGVMERWFSTGFRNSQPEQLALYRTMLSRTPRQGYVDCCKAIRDHAGFNHASNGKHVPVLCIGGGVDGSTPPDIVKTLTANIQGADYHEFESAGHLPCIEHPEHYASLLSDFCKDLEG
jgi:3-oxoadipate enol-lactonase